MKQLLFEDTLPAALRAFEIMTWVTWGAFAGAILYRDGAPEAINVVASADAFKDPFLGGSLGFILLLFAVWGANIFIMPWLKARYLEPAQ